MIYLNEESKFINTRKYTSKKTPTYSELNLVSKQKVIQILAHIWK